MLTEAPKVLSEKMPYDLYAPPRVPQYFVIQVRGKETPLHISIKKSSPVEELTMFSSFTNALPDEENHAAVFRGGYARIYSRQGYSRDR